MTFTTQNKKFPLQLHLLVLIIGMLVCGLLAVSQGKELSWDLANYHYYNPFAYLNHRSQLDYWPSSYIHGYLNPFLDFLTYFLMNHLTPGQAVFIMGCIHGVNFWLLFSIALLTLRLLPHIQHPLISALLLSVLGLYGPVALPGIGSFQLDNVVSIFVLSFVYLLLKSLIDYPKKKSLNQYIILLLGTIFLGFSAGAKLTAGIFAGGAFCSLLLLRLSWQERIRLLLISLVGFVVGFLFSSGYWMLILWQKYHNPIFPFWNGIFHSPFFPAYNWRDTRFLPKNWLQMIFYPFYFDFDGRTGESYFRDIRFALVYVCFAVYFFTLIFNKWYKKTSKTLPISLQWLFCFFICSYFLWLIYFSMMRYIVTLEMLAPLVIFLLLDQLITNSEYKFYLLLLLFFTIILVMVPVQTVRVRKFDGNYFNITLPASIKKIPPATILVAYPAGALEADPRPQTYLIPFFPKNWRFIGVPFRNQEYFLASIEREVKQRSLARIGLLSSENTMSKLYQAAQELGFRGKITCDNITDDRQATIKMPTMLCFVDKN